MMSVSVLQLNPEEIRIDLDEALRYVGYRKSHPDPVFLELAEQVEEKIPALLTPRVCYLEAQVQTEIERVDFGFLEVFSRGLAKHLSGCSRAYLFAATCGAALDREIARAQWRSAAEGALWDAMGSAAIEAVCNAVCDKFLQMESAGVHGGCLRTRFSPGYADLPLETQPDFLRVLDTNRRIGLTITERLMMTPIKSVTAIVGVSHSEESDGIEGLHNKGNCAVCNMTDCAYRKE